MGESPRGWGEEDAREGGDGEALDAEELLRERRELAQQRSAASEAARAASRDGTRGDEAMRLRDALREITFELAEARQNEVLLTAELRRVRREYDQGVVQHEQSMMAAAAAAAAAAAHANASTDSTDCTAVAGEGGGCGGGDISQSANALLVDDVGAIDGLLAMDESAMKEAVTRVQKLPGLCEREREQLRDRAQNAFLRTELNRLRAVLSKTWSEKQALQTSKAKEGQELRRSLSSATIKLERAETSRQGLEEELAASREREKLQLRNTKALQNHLASLREEKDSAAAAHARELEATVAAHREREAALRETISTLESRTHDLRAELDFERSHKREEAGRQERDMYEQFIAYRDLRKNNAKASDQHGAFLRSLALITGTKVPEPADASARASPPSSESRPCGAKEEQEQQQREREEFERQLQQQKDLHEELLGAVSTLKVNMLSERKHREAAERNFGICQKRLDRTLAKVERQSLDLEELQTAQQQMAGMSFSEYERWWADFKAQRRASKMQTSVRNLLATTRDKPRVASLIRSASQPQLGQSAEAGVAAGAADASSRVSAASQGPEDAVRTVYVDTVRSRRDELLPAEDPGLCSKPRLVPRAAAPGRKQRKVGYHWQAPRRRVPGGDGRLPEICGHS